MKTKIIAIAFLLLVKSAYTQKLKGSDTVLPLAQKEAESYMKVNKNAKLNVTGGGSGVGISALVDGTTDIAMSSRKIKLTEKMKLADAGKSFKETTIAFDALAVVVNPANKVTQLTREQLEGIFTGKVKNWKDVGGDDLQIVVYSRESSSGTYDFFKEHVMNNKNYASSVLSMPATGSIIQSISQTKGAIGYVGLAYVESDVRALKVSFDKGKNFIAPNMTTAKDRTYPIIRPLFYYYLATVEKAVKPFIDYCLSAEGQKIVETIGYVPLNKQ
jgi:phosphate transport system substrate-binding protein